MYRGLFPVIIATLSFGLGAQNLPVTGPEQPAEPTLVLPEIVLDLDNPDIQSVPGLLPAFEDLGFQGLGDDAPSVGRLDLGPEIYAQLLGPLVERPISLGPSETQDFDSVYTRGSVGVGLHQMLSGGVSIYQLGTNPELRFDFSHHYLDGAIVGTNWKNAGEGFKSQNSQFIGDFGVGFTRGNAGIEVGYQLEETGFQGIIPNIFGATIQDLHIIPRSSLDLSPGWTGSFEAEYAYVRRFYTSLGSNGASYDSRAWKVSPRIGARYEGDSLEADFSLTYRLRSNPQGNFENLLSPKIEAQWQALSWLGVDANVGGVFDFGELTKVPFLVNLHFDPVDEVAISLGGGYHVLSSGVETLWGDLPTLSDGGGTEFTHESWWQANLGTRFFPLDTLDIEIGMELRAFDTKLYLENLDDTSNPVNSWSLGSATEVSTNAQLNFRPITEIILSTGWVGQFLDNDSRIPDHQIDLRLEYRQVQSQFGGVIHTLFPIDSEDTTPRMTLTGWFSLGSVVEIEASFIDPFSLLLPQGRSAHPGLTPFKETGFRAEMLVALSL